MYDAYRCAKGRITVIIPRGGKLPTTPKCKQTDWKLQKSGVKLSEHPSMIGLDPKQALKEIQEKGYFLGKAEA